MSRKNQKYPEIPIFYLKIPINVGVLDRKAPQQLAGKTVGIKVSIFGNSSWHLTARNGPKRAVLGSPIASEKMLAAGEKNLLLSSIAEPLNFFCAASNPQTANAYLGTGLGQHSRPPTQALPQNESAY